MSDETAKRISKIAAIFLLLVFGWFHGFLSASLNFWPAEPVRDAMLLVDSYARSGAAVPGNRLSEAPPGAQRVPATVFDPEAAIGSGHYVLYVWEDTPGGKAVLLYDHEGVLKHRWPVDPSAFAPDLDLRITRPHAVEPLPDGSVIVGFDALAIAARLDACGEAIWTQNGVYHHSFQRAEDGGIWTWYGEAWATGEYQYMIKFDPETGEEIKRIGMIEDVLMKSDEQARILSLSQSDRFASDYENPRDLFHPNDVEELSSDLADAFDLFEAGDLLVSLRTLNLVMVLDQTGVIKWSQQGPWHQQHDPDFLPDGTISIFDNNSLRTDSDIIVIDPVTRETKSLLQNWDVPFYTRYRGKHQHLPNGNILLTIPEQGQVLEITPEREVAIEFNNIWARDSRLNDDIANAKWVPDGFFEEFPSCANPG